MNHSAAFTPLSPGLKWLGKADESSKTLRVRLRREANNTIREQQRDITTKECSSNVEAGTRTCPCGP